MRGVVVQQQEGWPVRRDMGQKVVKPLVEQLDGDPATWLHGKERIWRRVPGDLCVDEPLGWEDPERRDALPLTAGTAHDGDMHLGPRRNLVEPLILATKQRLLPPLLAVDARFVCIPNHRAISLFDQLLHDLEEVVDHYIQFFNFVKATAPPGVVPPVASTDGVNFDRQPKPEERAALLAYLRKL